MKDADDEARRARLPKSRTCRSTKCLMVSTSTAMCSAITSVPDPQLRLLAESRMTISAARWAIMDFEAAAKLSGRALRRAEKGLARLERAHRAVHARSAYERAWLHGSQSTALVRNDAMFGTGTACRNFDDDQFWAVRAIARRTRRSD